MESLRPTSGRRLLQLPGSWPSWPYLIDRSQTEAATRKPAADSNENALHNARAVTLVTSREDATRTAQQARLDMPTSSWKRPLAGTKSGRR